MKFRVRKIKAIAGWLLITGVMLSFFFLSRPESKTSAVVDRPKASSYRPFSVDHFTIGLNEDDYEFFFSDRPESFFVYQDAEMVINRKPVKFKAEIRIRGTHAWNWDKRKPSFRMRLKGDRKYNSRGIFDFINPDDASMLANLVADNIAVRMNVPSPRTVLATVNLNGDYRGLYHLAEPMNPQTLFNQGLERCSVIEGNMRNSKMWLHPNLWEIRSTLETDDSTALSALTSLLNMVKTPVDLAGLEKFSKLVDVDRMALWSALMSGIASIHTSDFLGNLLVYDFKTSRLFPAIADSTGFGVITSMAATHKEVDIRVPPYEFLTPLLNAFFRNPEFQYKRNLILYRLLNSELGSEAMEKTVKNFLKILRPLYYQEPYASALVNVPIVLFSRKIPVAPETQLADAQRLLDFMAARRKYLLEVLDATTGQIIKLPQRSNIAGRWFTHVLVRVKGHSPISFDFKGFGNAILPDFDFDNRLDSVLPEFYSVQQFFPGLGEKPADAPLWLMLKSRWCNFVLEPDYQNYVLGLSEERYADCLKFLRREGVNSITGKKIELEYLDEVSGETLEIKPNPVVLHSWRNKKNG